MNRVRPIAIVMLMACSAAPPPVAIVPGRSAVIGDNTFRTQATGTIVTARRVLGEQAATGQALLKQVDLGPAQHSPHIRLAGARAWFALARDLTKSSPHSAYEAAHHGASELGPDYAKPTVVDDTHTKQWLAEGEAEHGHHDRAAYTMTRVLQSRIRLYERRYALAVE